MQSRLLLTAFYKSRDKDLVDLGDKVVGEFKPIPIDRSEYKCTESPTYIWIMVKLFRSCRLVSNVSPISCRKIFVG